jgi:hypothetical protein
MNKAPTLILLMLLAALFTGCADANQPVPATDTSPAAQTNATTNAQNNTDPATDASPIAQTSTTTSAQTSTALPTPAQPAADKATVTGRVLSEDGNPVEEGTIVRLAETYYDGEDGAYALDESRSPGANTDAAGYFIFSDIPAREYVLIVGNIYAVYEVVSKPSGLPETYNAEPGKILNLGEIKVDL